MRSERILRAAAALVVAIAVGTLVAACAPSLVEPVVSISRTLARQADQFRAGASVELPAPSTGAAEQALPELPTGSIPRDVSPTASRPAATVAATVTKDPTPPPAATATATVAPDPTAARTAPTPTPTPIPTVTLEEFWKRMHTIAYAPVVDDLTILPPNHRDDPLFGINNALAMEDTAAPFVHGAGASIDRVEVRWDTLEPSPGHFQFERLDRIVAQSERWNLKILAVVDGAPSWAVDRPERIGAGPPNGLDQPPFLADGSPNPRNPWAVFLATVSRRYGNRIAAWEVWNEPNFRDFWRGSPTDYARLFSTARQVLHGTAPDAPVLIGGMVEDDGGFLRSVVETLCPNHTCPTPPFDAVAWHVYGNPTAVLSLTDRTRALLAPYHVKPAIWVTEANVAVDDPRTPDLANGAPDAVTLSQQAAFVTQLYALARAADVRTVAIYRASDVDEGNHWGLLRNNLTARPAYFAYYTAARWFSHARFARLSHPIPSATWVQLRDQTEQVNVVWTDDTRPVQIKIPAGRATGLLVRSTGESQSIRAEGGAFQIQLPPAPPRRPQTAPLAEPLILIVQD